MFKWIQRSNICSEQKSWSDFYFSAALTFQESFSKQNFYACAWAKRSDIVATFHLHSSSVKSPLKNKLFVFPCSVFFWLFCFKIRCDLQIHFTKAILHLTECEWNVAATLLFFLLLHMRKRFVYWHFPELSIPLKSRNHFNFSAPNKCHFLFKQIIFEYSFKQSESL